MVSRTNSRQLHCFFIGALPKVASVDERKRPFSGFSPLAKVLRLGIITERNLVTLVGSKDVFTTLKGMLPTDPPIK